jgi:methanogenic corrinoid protein MtbC1
MIICYSGGLGDGSKIFVIGILMQNDKCDKDDVSCRVYFESLIDGVKELLNSKVADIESQTTNARESMEKRLDALNEIRGAMTDQARMFLPRTEYRASHEAMEKSLSEVRDDMMQARGKASQGQFLITAIISVVALLIALLSVIINWGK